MSSKIGIVIQARVGSTRFPSKVLRDVDGRTVMEWVIERARLARRTDLVICAIPDTPANDELARVCEAFGAPVVRGSEHDVIARYRASCDRFALTDFVRITSDCPLIDPSIIDRAIAAHESGRHDLSANRVDEPGAFPRGMDVEVVRASVLNTLDATALEPRYREHVTLYLYENPGQFSIHYIEPEPDEARPRIRLCIDHPEDLELVRRVAEHFAGRRDFSLPEIVQLLDNRPDLTGLNDHHK